MQKSKIRGRRNRSVGLMSATEGGVVATNSFLEWGH